MNSSRSEPAKMRPAVTDFATGLEVWLLVDWLEPESKAIVRRRVACWISKRWRLPRAATLWSQLHGISPCYSVWLLLESPLSRASEQVEWTWWEPGDLGSVCPT